MSGEWSGGAANRTWHRKGHRGAPVEGDAERGPLLYAQLASTYMWCEHCHGTHKLADLRNCPERPR